MDIVARAGLVELNATLFFQIVNFLVLFFLLKKLLFKPVSEFMASRREEVEASLKNAKDKNGQADLKYNEYQVKLETVEDEGRQIIREKTKIAEARHMEIVEGAQKEASRMIDRAEAEIKRQNQKAMNEMKDHVASLVVAATGKMINKQLDEETHNTLIQEFIDEVGDAKWQN
ncbi:F0F1 ATP synthase subunit B [Lutibacter sp. B2]|nr:F0F1 ATP synthase subunit B [Lutibacter sp. B2]